LPVGWAGSVCQAPLSLGAIGGGARCDSALGDVAVAVLLPHRA
jgi:hypothetical protein